MELGIYMKFGQERLFFVTSSIPESRSDWKSVFIGDMLKAFSNRQEKLLYWGPRGVVPVNTVNTVSNKHQFWLKKMMQKGGIARILRNGSLINKIFYPAILLLGIRSSANTYNDEFDIYFVNWLQNSISLPADGKELVITVLGSDMGLIDIWIIKCLLKRVFRDHKTTLLPNAKWMVEPLESAFGAVAEIRLQELGIRDDWFTDASREPSLWLSVSRITEKKVRKLFNWGENIFSQRNKLTFIGPNQEALIIPEWIDFNGSATLNELKSNWYPKARALIFLSDHDEGRPQTIIEAMASGVPVICLDKPLYREFIDSGFNSYLVSNNKELKTAIEKLSNESHNLNISKNARESIKEKVGGWEQYVDETIKAIAH